ncbi:hypothetical protein SteCoe_25470 [Stentor coeruleus]|uniref:RGS domain-containing protein n=1 Tax=Stentor coeruleus TaxID=5963 RepID=A0A1R2BCL8_9CILI|nr:hypothetical protein SteCoe_26549 [Stentor coeruleus]OMJ75393.1 hypothetical protein SteCoe_25470 [Stentor coeruleus]
MENQSIFISTTILFGLFFSGNFYFYYINRYDLNALNRSRYLMINQLVFLVIHTHCCITLVYLDMPDMPKKIISFIFLISHSGFFVVYFLFVYRIILLNDIEFGRLNSSQYSKILNKLSWKWNFKISSIYIITCSVVLVLLFDIFSDTNSVVKAVSFGNKKPSQLIFALIFFSVGYAEYLCFAYLFYKVLRGKFRFTLKIEVFLDLLIWTAYYTYRFVNSEYDNYGFSMLLRNFSLCAILILTFTFRSRICKIPFPPVESFSLLFVFENKTIYDSFYEYLSNFKDHRAVKMLELGLYISMHKFKPKKKLEKAIGFACSNIQGLEGQRTNIDEVEIIVFDELYNSFKDFLSSEIFGELRMKSILVNRLLLF